MKKSILLSLSCIALCFMGCKESKTEEKSQNNSTVVINQIEKTITKKDSNIGCNDNRTEEECSEESDSSKFILNTLAKEESNNIENKNISSIKENLNRSLEEISKEEQKTEKLKEELVAFVNSNNHNRGKELEDFINSTEEYKNDKESKEQNSNRIALIKNELNNLILQEPTVKSKDIKKRLDSLMSDITTSKQTLSQTKTTLQNLVDKVEKTGTKSDKKFASAIIQDVSTNKISILEENENYFIITVQEGDNLSILAKRYYSDTDKFKLIYDANKDKINSKYEIYPGSKLLIPKI